ncbi:MAG: hypothetical protein ACYSRP_09400 [Planctomycetota bacterium]|jgi:hypothetical protein
MDKGDAKTILLGVFLFLAAIATHVFAGIGYYLLYGVPAVVVASFMPGIGWIGFLALWLNRWDTMSAYWVFWAFVGSLSCVVVCLCLLGMQGIMEASRQEAIEEVGQDMGLESSTAG